MWASKSRGFTLIELMIVVAVIAILAIIAIPTYFAQIRKSRRSDAIATINTVVLNEERWRTNCPAYATFGDTSCGTTAFMATPTSTYYTFALAAVGANAYTVTGTPIGTQLKDQQFGTSCNLLTYSFQPPAVGQPSVITTTPATCWGQ